MRHSLGAISVCLSVCLSVFVSVCLSVLPSVSICLYVSLSVSLPPAPSPSLSFLSHSFPSISSLSVSQSHSLNERLTPSSLNNPAGHPLIAGELRGGRRDAANCPWPRPPCTSCPCRQEKRGATAGRPAPACRRNQHQLRGREGDGAFRRAIVAGTRILPRRDCRVGS